MKRGRHLRAAAAAAWALCAGLCGAKTLAWYHFDEVAAGEKPAGGAAVFLNAADPSLFPATAWTRNNDLSLSTRADYLPCGAAAFPDGAGWYDPAAGAWGENARCLRFTAEKIDFAAGSIVTVADDERLHVPSVTVEAFVRYDGPETISNWRQILVKSNLDGSRDAWSLRMGADGLVIARVHALTDETEGTVKECTAGHPTKINDGRWHHLALVVDGAKRTMTVFVDYKAGKTFDLPGALHYGDKGYPLMIGCMALNTYGMWPGEIDEVRLSDAPLAAEAFLRPNTGRANCHPETVVYVPFDPLPFFGDGQTLPELLLNQAPQTPFAAVKSVRLIVQKAGDACLTNEVAASALRRDVFAAQAVSNAASLFTAVERDDRDLCPYLALNDVEGGFHTALTNSFTLEIFGKFEKPSGKGSGQTSYLFFGHNGSAGRLIAQVGKDGVLSWSPHWQEGGKVQVCDGAWHHVAVTYDRAAQTTRLFCDYRLVAEKTGLDFDAAHAGTSYPEIEIGNGYAAQQSGVHGLMDGFRLTARALEPQEFLTGHGAAAVDYAAWIDFEGDACVAPYPDVTPEGTFAALPDGLVPARTGQVPARWLAGPKGVRGRANAEALALAGGSVAYGRNLMIENLAEQTVEFFLRGTSAAEGAGVLRLEDGAGEAVWAVEAAADGKARVRAGGVVHTFGASLADGAWHHWALTCAAGADGAATTVTLWRDHAAVGSFTAGTLRRAFTSSSLVIGGGAALVGVLDEIRVTPRVLDAAAFLRGYFAGTTLLLR